MCIRDRAIINNSKNKIILNLETDEARTVQETLKLTRSETRAITQFERGEALICSNSNKVPVVIKASQTELEMITTCLLYTAWAAALAPAVAMRRWPPLPCPRWGRWAVTPTGPGMASPAGWSGAPALSPGAMPRQGFPSPGFLGVPLGLSLIHIWKKPRCGFGTFITRVSFSVLEL